ncbi:MAG: hypothetical protein J5736_02630, partial [Bacilli bacterium]|nr:hypothetical protein [Bacilli bacterium]
PCSDTKIPLHGKSKKGSSKLVHRFFPQIATESKPYDAQAFQLKAIKDAFQYDSYHLDSLLDRIALYSDDINDPPSTNILPLLKAFIRNQLNGLSGSE